MDYFSASRSQESWKSQNDPHEFTSGTMKRFLKKDSTRRARFNRAIANHFANHFAFYRTRSMLIITKHNRDIRRNVWLLLHDITRWILEEGSKTREKMTDSIDNGKKSIDSSSILWRNVLAIIVTERKAKKCKQDIQKSQLLAKAAIARIKVAFSSRRRSRSTAISCCCFKRRASSAMILWSRSSRRDSSLLFSSCARSINWKPNHFLAFLIVKGKYYTSQFLDTWAMPSLH